MCPTFSWQCNNLLHIKKDFSFTNEHYTLISDVMEKVKIFNQTSQCLSGVIASVSNFILENELFTLLKKQTLYQIELKKLNDMISNRIAKKNINVLDDDFKSQFAKVYENLEVFVTETYLCLIKHKLSKKI